MAQALHADACRAHAMVGWIVMKDTLQYPGKVAARLVTDASTPYPLIAGTLAELQASLSLGLTRKERQADDPPEMVEIWFST